MCDFYRETYVSMSNNDWLQLPIIHYLLFGGILFTIKFYVEYCFHQGIYPIGFGIINFRRVSRPLGPSP